MLRASHVPSFSSYNYRWMAAGDDEPPIPEATAVEFFSKFAERRDLVAPNNKSAFDFLLDVCCGGQKSDAAKAYRVRRDVARKNIRNLTVLGPYATFELLRYEKIRKNDRMRRLPSDTDLRLSVRHPQMNEKTLLPYWPASYDDQLCATNFPVPTRAEQDRDGYRLEPNFRTIDDQAEDATPDALKYEKVLNANFSYGQSEGSNWQEGQPLDANYFPTWDTSSLFALPDATNIATSLVQPGTSNLSSPGSAELYNTLFPDVNSSLQQDLPTDDWGYFLNDFSLTEPPDMFVKFGGNFLAQTKTPAPSEHDVRASPLAERLSNAGILRSIRKTNLHSDPEAVFDDSYDPKQFALVQNEPTFATPFWKLSLLDEESLFDNEGQALSLNVNRKLSKPPLLPASFWNTELLVEHQADQ